MEIFLILWVTKLIGKESPMYAVLDKDTIKNEIMPYFHHKTQLCYKMFYVGGERFSLQAHNGLPMVIPTCEAVIMAMLYLSKGSFSILNRIYTIEVKIVEH